LSIVTSKQCIFLCFINHSYFFLLYKESEVDTVGNQWIAPVLKGMRKSSPIAMKITLRSV
jgi:3-hydroxyisobutyryl-CoA hydrolase